MREIDLNLQETLTEMAGISGSTAHLVELFSRFTNDHPRAALVVEPAHGSYPRKLQIVGITTDQLAVLVLLENNWMIPSGNYTYTNADRGTTLLFLAGRWKERVVDLYENARQRTSHWIGEEMCQGIIQAFPDHYYGGRLTCSLAARGLYLGGYTTIFLEIATAASKLEKIEDSDPNSIKNWTQCYAIA
ncbi:MAG: hypothetical protein C4584_01030 [Armatimonadetes bacterium]|nr:MAG: hypothetical protein C4584_01030 [Armatimonadota bacterium]